ncbi:MAG: class I tRNA ligase family protein, partial [Desulfosalsimonas sp.]
VEGISEKKLADFWLHGGHVLLAGKKMSKSKGNILYIKDLLNRGYEPHHIRFLLIYGGYRKSLNLNENRVHCARGRVDAFRAMAGRIREQEQPAARGTSEAASLAGRLEPDFKSRMNDNLDVKSAFDRTYSSVCRLLDLAIQGNLGSEGVNAVQKSLARIDSVLKILF